MIAGSSRRRITWNAKAISYVCVESLINQLYISPFVTDCEIVV
jgi:hypothetical protein